MHDDLVLIEAGGVRDGFARVAGRARELQRLGPVEGRALSDFAQLRAVDAAQGGFGGRAGFAAGFGGLAAAGFGAWTFMLDGECWVC